MESVESIRAALLPGMRTYSIDLKDACLHIFIHLKSRRFLCVFFKGRAYQFKALPFGLSSAPWLFIIVAKEFASLIHNQNMTLNQFLDNWMDWAMSRER